MTVIDRYLLAVRAFLPRAVQRDIIAELSEDLRSRVEEREAALGRPLSDAEQESLVKDLGHPALLAGRYGPRRQLIGPEMFPFYWLVLRLALGVGILVHVTIAIAMLVGGKTAQAIRQVTVILPIVAWVQFSVITLAFAALDAYGVLTRFTRPWNPRTLPATGFRARPVLHIAVAVLLAVWWLAALRYPFLVFGPGASVVKLAPIWMSLYVPTLLLMLGDIAWQTVGLVRPQWTRIRVLVRIALAMLQLVVLYALARAGEWVVIANPTRQTERLQQIVAAFNQFFPWGLALAAVALVVVTAIQLMMICCLDKGAAPAH